MKNERLLKRLRDLGFIFILLLILACVLWECHKWGLDLRSEFSSVLNLFLIDFAFLLSTFDFPEAGKKKHENASNFRYYCFSYGMYSLYSPLELGTHHR